LGGNAVTQGFLVPSEPNKDGPRLIPRLRCREPQRFSLWPCTRRGDSRRRQEILGSNGACHIGTRGGAIVRYMGDTEHGGQAAWMDVRQGLERESDVDQAIRRVWKPPPTRATT